MHALARPVRPCVLVIAILAVLAACESPTTPAPKSVALLQSGHGSLADRSAGEGLRVVNFSNRETFAPIGGWEHPTGPTIACGPLTLQSTYVGSGIMTHAGADHSIATWQTCTFTSPQNIVVTGVGAFEVASGDSIKGSFVQNFSAVTPTSSSFTIALTITGGTGRFEGATGQASAIGARQNFSASWVMNGTLFLPPKH